MAQKAHEAPQEKAQEDEAEGPLNDYCVLGLVDLSFSAIVESRDLH